MRIRLVLLFLAITNFAFADAVGYSDTLMLKVESENLIVVHFHNWTSTTKGARFKMISTDQDPFTSTNNYSYLECIDKKTGKQIFKTPCSALTKIVISSDEKFILGISKIMLLNPYQLVIFSTQGNLIKKRHIGDTEAKLTKQQLESFKELYPSQFEFLSSNEKIYHDSEFYFLDFMSQNMHKKLGKAWYYLYNFSVRNHLSKYFSETVTNSVYWYYEAEPDISFNYSGPKLISVSLLDPRQNKISINIEE